MGEGQARRVATYLRDHYGTFDAVYSSPLRRARQTSDNVVAALGAKYRVADDLREGHLGAWNGQRISALDWQLLVDDPTFVGHEGESPQQLATRSSSALRGIAESHQGATTLVVAHGAMISHGLAALMATRPLTGPQYQLANTGIATLHLAETPQVVLTDEHLS